MSSDALTSWYPKLRKSRFVLPLWAFVLVAVLYYLICGTILFCLLVRVPFSREQRVALRWLLVMMAGTRNRITSYLAGAVHAPDCLG